MTERHEAMRQAAAWVERAEHDLRNAEYVLTMPDNCPADTVCFHCQQSAEKYLKALLAFHGVDFPRTHDVVVLINLVRAVADLALDMERVQPLNRYSTEGRYPGDWDPIDVHEAARALEMARGVRGAVPTRAARGSVPGRRVGALAGAACQRISSGSSSAR